MTTHHLPNRKPARSLAVWLTAIAITLPGALPQPAVAGPSGLDSLSMGGLPGVAAREIARREAMIEQARVLMVEGDELASKGNHAGALEKYRQALDLLPIAPISEQMRAQIGARFGKAAVAHARQLADEGDYAEARRLLNETLQADRDPGNRAAARLLAQLDDSDRFPPALTPQHVANVREVESLLRMGESHYLLGNFDQAESQFFRVLTIDRYNTAARNFLEHIERTRMNYYGAAYNHTRARMLRMVDQAWETKPPLTRSMDEVIFGGPVEEGIDLRRENSDALQTIIIPTVNFQEITLSEAIEYLRIQSRQHDRRPGRTPENRGVNILVRSARVAGGEAVPVGEKVIEELVLRNPTPLGEVLRYVSELTQMRIRIEQFAVVLVPIADGGADELYTRSFRVPPDFIPSAGEGGGGAAVIDDPFAPGAGGGGAGAISPRMTAEQYLRDRGVPFPDGASASFDARTSTLTVRNSPQAMETVEAIVDDSIRNAPKQVTIETKFVEVAQLNSQELGFDWLLGPAAISTNNGIAVAGGVAGNGIPLDAANYPILEPFSQILGGQPVPLGQNPITSGNRSGDFGVRSDGIDSLIGRTSSENTAAADAPRILSIAGVLTEPQFQMVIRALDQKKGTDLLSAPSITTRSGLPARIEVIREFIYPTEYDPPELPNTVGNNNNNNDGGGGGIGGPATVASFPVTPATPTSFDTKNIGVTLDVDPIVDSNGYTINLTLKPEVIEFEGFINYGSPINASAIDGLGRPTQVTITENRIEMPVFSVRRVSTQVTVWDGQTVAIGGLMREDVQEIEDKVPILGDLPLVGRLFMTKASERFKRNLMVFVTARLIDPSGKPVNQFDNDDPTFTPSTPSQPVIVPQDGMTPSLFPLE